MAARSSLPRLSGSPEDAGAHLTWMADLLALDAPASNTLTRELLGWQPTEVGLIEDLDLDHYFLN